jgi:hypothetical protein
MERQDLMKENEKMCTALRPTVAESVKMKSDDQTLLKEGKRVTSLETKLTADQRIFEPLTRY